MNIPQVEYPDGVFDITSEPDYIAANSTNADATESFFGSWVRKLFISDEVTQSQIENQDQLNMKWAQIRAEGLIDEDAFAEGAAKHKWGVSGERLQAETDADIGAEAFDDIKESVSVVQRKASEFIGKTLGITWETMPATLKIAIVGLAGFWLYRFFRVK